MADDAVVEPSAAPADQPVTSPPPGGDWRSSLSEELRGNKSLERYQTLDAFAKGHVELEKKLGERPTGLTMPKPDASPEEWAKFYGAIGRPESPDKYELAKPEKLPEGLAWRPEWEAKAREVAHGLGLTPKQFAGLVDLYNGMRLEELTGAETYTASQRKEAEAALAKEWGPKDGPVYRHNLGAVRELVAKVFEGDKDLAEAIEDRGNNAALLRGLLRLVPMAREDGLIAGEPVYGASLEDLDKEINALLEEQGKVTMGSRRAQEIQDRKDTLWKQKLALSNGR